MSGLTWGVGTKDGERVASVFCPICREVMERNVTPGEAGVIVQTRNHKCTWHHDWNGNKARRFV